jgi:hypothetical protein
MRLAASIAILLLTSVEVGMEPLLIPYALLVKLYDTGCEIILANAVAQNSFGCTNIFEQAFEERQLVRFKSVRQR